MFKQGICGVIKLDLRQTGMYINNQLFQHKQKQGIMNKADLIEEVAKVTCSKKEAVLALDAILAAIQKTLKKGNDVTLVGFGTFKISKRKARVGRNPQTGKALKIAAKKVPVFKAGKGLKDAVK